MIPWRSSEVAVVLEDLPTTWARGPEANGVL
jgi:hypothetical protein